MHILGAPAVLPGKGVARRAAGLTRAAHRGGKDRVMKPLRLLQAVLVGLVTVGTAAYADEPRDRNEPRLLTPYGMSAEIGGGVLGFTSSKATDVTQVGGSWTARLVIGTRSHVGVEAAYIGSAQGMNTLGLSDSAYLMSQGAEGALRLNALTGAWQPYAVAGAAWRHYSIQNSSFNTSDVKSSDDVAEVPVGLGVAYRYRGVVADLRVQLRPSFNSSLIGDTNLTTWNAGAKIGWEF